VIEPFGFTRSGVGVGAATLTACAPARDAQTQSNTQTAAAKRSDERAPEEDDEWGRTDDE